MVRQTIMLVSLRGLIIWIGVLFGSTSGFCDPGNNKDLSAKVEGIATDIRSQPHPDARTRATRELALFVRSNERATLDNISPEAVTAIASLLRDRVEAVQAWAAIALGEIGPAASIAVPDLENASKPREPDLPSIPLIGKVGTSASAASEINDALTKIRATPGPR
jgi:HEAT repeat protein